MNKIMLYVGLAILLGTVTMVAPLALLGPEDHIPDDNQLLTIPGEYVITDPESTEPDSQDRSYEEGGTLESGNFSAQTKTPEPTLSVPVEPSGLVTSPEVPQEPELTFKTADTPSDLSPIGLMTIPSFLLALGVFVFLRKRMS